MIFKGQKKFKKIVEEDFLLAYSVIQSADTFQDGWKVLTGMPQQGDHNPNYKDCLVYIEAILERDFHKVAVCPRLPVEARVKDQRPDMDSETYWHLINGFCNTYKHFVGKVKKPKPFVDWLYDLGMIDPFDNDFAYLGQFYATFLWVSGRKEQSGKGDCQDPGF